MREAIKQMIEDYKRRMQSANDMLAKTTDVEQFHRVSGRYEAYEKIVRDLQEVLTHETNNQHRSDGRGTDDAEG